MTTAINQLSTIYATIKAYEARALASAKPSVQDFGAKLSAAADAFKVAFPDLVESVFDAGVVAIGTAEPILAPLEGVVETIGNPIAGSLAKMLEGFVFGAAAAPVEEQPVPQPVAE